MKQIEILLSTFIFLAFGQLFGQSPVAYVHVDSVLIAEKVNFQMDLNGVDLLTAKTLLEVPINQFGFDTISHNLFRTGETHKAILKLKKNTHYLLNSNDCSFYTIQPMNKAFQGMVHFSIESQDTVSYLVGIGDYNYRILNSITLDEFYYTPPSAMCEYSAKSIEIRNIDRKLIKKFKYHFLHGELLSVKYNVANNTNNLTLLGHVRNENDFRYYDDLER